MRKCILHYETVHPLNRQCIYVLFKVNSYELIINLKKRAMSFKYLLLILGLIIAALISFIEESVSQPITFDKHTLSNSFTQGCEVCLADLNKDGRTDIVACGNGNNGQIVWWENKGFHSFEKHTVAENMHRVRSIHAWDINKDGEQDIIAAAWEGNSVTWLENDGVENFTIHYIDDNFIGAHTVDVTDVDFDGKYDVLCSGFDMSSTNSEIAWWKNNLPDTNWTKHVISTRFQQSPFIHGDDMDGDGDIDILACGELNGEVYWWENDGNQNWTEHEIDNAFPKAHTVFIRNVDGDNDMDIVGAACMSSQIAWWENDGNENFTKHPLGTFAGALWLDVCDLDMDGDRDLYGGGQGENHLAWWENDGNENFTRHDLADAFSQTFCVVHGDLDLDGDPDLTATGYMSNQTAWFENDLYDPSKYNKPECVVYDALMERYIVANIGNGCLIETDTANDASYWISGYDSFYGMCLDGNILYTSDGDTLMGFNVLNKQRVLAMHISNLNNLDGMTVDGNGFLYVLDTGGRLIKVNIENETYEILTSSGLPNWPQDCVYDPFNQRVVVAAFQADSPIVAVDPETGDVSTLTTISTGYYDGITIDQYGNFYFSTFVAGGRVYKYPNDFSTRNVIATNLGEPTGLNYNQYDNILAVPSFNKDTVFFIPISTIGIEDYSMDNQLDLEAFPNPCDDLLKLRFSKIEDQKSMIEIVNVSGSNIKTIPLNDQAYYSNEVSIDVSDLPSGIYFIKLRANKKTAVKKVVVM